MPWCKVIMYLLFVNYFKVKEKKTDLCPFPVCECDFSSLLCVIVVFTFNPSALCREAGSDIDNGVPSVTDWSSTSSQMNFSFWYNAGRQIKQCSVSGTLGQSSAINTVTAWVSGGGTQVATAVAAALAGMRRPVGSPTSLPVTVDQSPWADQRHLTPATRGADCFHALTDTTRLGWGHPN